MSALIKLAVSRFICELIRKGNLLKKEEKEVEEEEEEKEKEKGVFDGWAGHGLWVYRGMGGWEVLRRLQRSALRGPEALVKYTVLFVMRNHRF